jgi:hypothetical protein
MNALLHPLASRRSRADQKLDARAKFKPSASPIFDKSVTPKLLKIPEKRQGQLVGKALGIILHICLH